MNRPAAALGAALRPDALDERRCALMDDVRRLSLPVFFRRTTLKQAEVLAADATLWHPPVAWFQPDGSTAQALQCEVDDADGAHQCVTVYLYALFGEDAVESRCTCADERCVHAAALLLRLQRLLDWPRAMTPVERWLHSVQAMQEPAGRPSVRFVESEPWPVLCLLALDTKTPLPRPTVRLVLAPDSAARQWLPIGHARAQSHASRQAMLWQTRLAMLQPRTHASRSGFVLTGAAGADLLTELLQAGICRRAETLQPIRLSEPRQPPWHWQQDECGDSRIGLHWPAESDIRIFDLDGLHYLDLASGELGALQLGRTTWETVHALPPVPAVEIPTLAAAWPPHPSLDAVPPPPRPMPIRRVDVPLRPIVVLGAARHTQRGDHVFHVRALAGYGACRLPLADTAWQQEVIRRVDGIQVRIRRDVETELRASRVLAQTGLVSLASLLPDARRLLAPTPDIRALGHREHYEGGAETFAALEAALQALTRAGFTLEYDPEMPFTVLPAETQLQAVLDDSERAGYTQFELAAQIDGEAVNLLPAVLHGLAQHAFSLTPAADEPPDAHWLAPVGAGRWLPLPLAHLREWMAPLIECLDRSNVGDAAAVRVTRAQAMALSQALDREGVTVAGDQAASIAETLALLRAATLSATDVAVPPAFHGELRGYQREGLKWLQALRQCRLGGVLADDMGLGKTVQVIAHLLVEHEAGRLTRPALVVAPTSLVFNWLDEMARFAPTLECVGYTGPRRAALRSALVSAQVIVTSYALLAIDLDVLQEIDYSMLVLDEAQWIKNPATRAARAARKLHAEHRLVVTGTPLENHLGELWAHFDSVLPGYLGDYRAFKRSFRQPIELRHDDARRAILSQRIAPFLLRRDKASVAPELPPKTETILRVALDEPQRRLYESLRLALSKQVRDALAQYNPEQSRIVVLSALLRLRQICCDPRLVEHDGEPPASAKLAALLELIESLRADERQILVFSQFTSMLALIGKALDARHLAYATLTGDTTDRAAPVRRFQAHAVPILLASLKAGGVGLNLTAADAVIHYEPWWNPAVETQAIDRAHRIGRERPVFVYKLLCEDTIEEKIEAMKREKSQLADAVLGSVQASTPRLDADALYRLFDAPAR